MDTLWMQKVNNDKLFEPVDCLLSFFIFIHLDKYTLLQRTKTDKAENNDHVIS